MLVSQAVLFVNCEMPMNLVRLNSEQVKTEKCRQKSLAQLRAISLKGQ